ncbi:MAG: hypothetical protein ACE5IR_13120 [bacterium]
MENHDFEKASSQKLEQWQTSLDHIRSQAENVLPQQQLEFYRQLDLLEAKLELAHIKLAQFRQADDATRDQLKARLDAIFNEIENALDSANAKIGQ